MKLRKNYFKILCSMLFCFTLGAVGCSNGDPAASSGDPGSTSLAPDEFLVTFNTKGGTAVAQQVIKAGNKVTKPQDPTQEYYTFTGWYWDFEEATPFDFESATIASNTTIYAGWAPDHAALDNEPAVYEEKTYTITGFPSWIKNNECVVFVKGTSASSTQYYKLTYTDVGGTFKTNGDLTKFILYRCQKDTVNPIEAPAADPGDSAGKIYNCTGEYNMISGTYSYAAPEANWYGYNYFM